MMAKRLRRVSIYSSCALPQAKRKKRKFFCKIREFQISGAVNGNGILAYYLFRTQKLGTVGIDFSNRNHREISNLGPGIEFGIRRDFHLFTAVAIQHGIAVRDAFIATSAE